MDPRNIGQHWFAVQVRRGREELCARALAYKGYEGFLPMGRFSLSRSGEAHARFLPLFPGYLFCRIGSQITGLLMSTLGVVRIVGCGGIAIQITDDEISNIRLLVEARCRVSKSPYLRVGQRVRIIAGPLKGLEGLLINVRNSRKLVLSVETLQRSVAVEVDEDSTETLSS
jgi:transcription antitermination factor NusG